ncbi:MAG: DUF4112 domain-containing protein [Gemmatimonadaceae bacterium]
MSRTNRQVTVPGDGTTPVTSVESRIRRVRLLGKLLDNSIPIPGTGWKIGLDPIIGLIPGVGDLIGGILSGYIILESARAQVPTLTLMRMLTNVGIDTLVGAVPAVGDLFDAAWKANVKNVALLERHLVARTVEIQEEERSAFGITLLAVLLLVLIVALGLALGVYVARLLWGLRTQ